jgi:hypothetical protein
MDSALTVKKDQHALDDWPDLPCSLCKWRGLLFGLWVITVNPDFISCYDTEEEVTIVSDLVQQFMAHTCQCSCWYMSNCGRKILGLCSVFWVTVLFIMFYIYMMQSDSSRLNLCLLNNTYLLIIDAPIKLMSLELYTVSQAIAAYWNMVSKILILTNMLN